MPKIICTIPGAPEQIGGLTGIIDFKATEAGLVADVGEDDAAHFLAIPGYALAEDAGKADAERAALLERAAAVNLVVDSRWKMPRLKSEVEHAEKLAAAGAQ